MGALSLAVQALRLQRSQLWIDRSTTGSLEKLSEQPTERIAPNCMERQRCVPLISSKASQVVLCFLISLIGILT